MGDVPLPGPTAAKTGIRYEDAWTAHCALRILGGEARWIYLEEPGTEAEGFEFSLALEDAIQYHQVKRQRAGDGGWSLKALASARVLGAFRSKLASPEAVCVFASGNAAQTLDDLATSAQKSEDWATFGRGVLKYDTRSTHFQQLREIWEADELWTFEALRRVQVETIGERQLGHMLRLQAEVLLEGAIETAPGTLVAILGRRINERVDASMLWVDLAKAGFKPNPWRSSSELSARVRAVNGSFTNSRRITLIGDELISRPEAAGIREALEEHRVVLVEGEAGAGKSDVLYELTKQLDDQTVPYLAFRLDRWQATASPGALAAEMGLPVSPPAALAALCPDKPCVLIIDQLDAMSSTSGRNTEFFECVDEMLRLAETRPQMSVVLACRHFDVRNDARLRRLVGDNRYRISVGQLSGEQVTSTLTRLAIAEDRVTPQLRELLRVPLHLALLAQSSPVDPADLPEIKTLRDLYDEFWKSKQAELAQRLGRNSDWIPVLDALVEDMNARASLQAPMELVDEWEADCTAMRSASVLVEDKGQLAFFHETFFDYVFARRFFAQRRTVRDLLASDQLLFRRAQVRQLLAYERQGDFDAYAEDLQYLLLDPGVRFHLQDLVLGWLATAETPLRIEWEVLKELLGIARTSVLRRVHTAISSPAWFAFLDGLGVIEGWLADDSTTGLALQVITAGQTESPARAAGLLASYRERSPTAANDVAAVLRRSGLADSREAFELFVGVLDTDDRDLGRSDFFYLARDLPEKHPDWGCELLGAYLRNRLRAADAAGVVNPFDYRKPVIPRQLHIHDLVSSSARSAPQTFIDHVLPQMLRIIERTARPEHGDETELVADEVWSAAYTGRHREDSDDELLAGAEIALRQLASEDPQRFLKLAHEHDRSEYETVWALLFEGFRARSEDLANAAADFVLADTRLLRVGRSSGDNWASRQLFQAISPHCSDERFARLEAQVLEHFTVWERSKEGRKALGYSQFSILEGMPFDRLSDLGQRRLREWQRKFETTAPHEPLGVTGGAVGSPIPSDATRKMKDAHWLRAFERYHSTDSDPRDFLKGGAHQLSQELEARAKEDPVRFVGLAGQMPDDAHVYYFYALLRGVAASDHEVTIEATRSLVERCHALPGRPCGRWIAQPLRRHSDTPLPRDLIDVLTWYAVNDPDPPEVSSDFSGDISDDRRVQMQGLNSVRGSIAYEIAAHISRHEESIEPFSQAVESLVVDRSVAVRGMAIRTLIGLMRHRPQRAVELFVELASHPNDLILAGHEAHEFLRYAGTRHFEDVQSVIQRMVQSKNSAVRTCGAVHAALAALDGVAAESLAAGCLAGDPALRLGVARVNAANVLKAPHRARCEAQLISLFDDPDSEVRKATSEVFRELAGENFANDEQLIDAFLTSGAFDTEGAEALLHAFEYAEAPPPRLSLGVCRAYLDADFAESHAVGGSMSLHNVGELALRAYADASDQVGHNTALDIIDRVLELDTFRVAAALADYDR